MFYGKGAGKLPTASAVVADIIDCVKHFKARKYLYWDDAQEGYVSPYEDSVISVYIRAAAENDHKGLRIAEKPLERSNVWCGLTRRKANSLLLRSLSP